MNPESFEVVGEEKNPEPTEQVFETKDESEQIDEQINIPVKISYTLTDNKYGQNPVEKVCESFDLDEPYTYDKWFDGFIVTNEASFAFDGRLADAVKIIEEIKDYCESSAKLKKLYILRKDVDQEVEIGGNIYRNKNDDKPIILAKRKLSKLNIEIGSLELNVRILADKLRSFKL